MLAVTLKDVAARANVSRSAVSRTFTEGASVSKKTRLKVEKAARELGYTPSVLAAALSTGRTKLIGLISNNFHNPIFLQIFDLFTSMLQERNLRPLLVNLSEETDPAHSLRMLQQYSVDGVIVASSTLPPEFSEAFKNAGLPIVHSFGSFASSSNVDVVGIDNAAAGRLAAATLIERRYRRVAFLGGPRQATSTVDRLKGFMEVVTTQSSIGYSQSFASAYSFEAGRAEMMRLIGNEDLAEAYFCGDDVLAIGVMSALQDNGFNIPGDVGILGLNNMEIAGWDNLALTTINLPIRDIIKASIDLVVSRIEDADRSAEARIFPARLVERRTLRRAGDVDLV